jgi:hypothetical protein
MNPRGRTILRINKNNRVGSIYLWLIEKRFNGECELARIQ